MARASAITFSTMPGVLCQQPVPKHDDSIVITLKTLRDLGLVLCDVLDISERFPANLKHAIIHIQYHGVPTIVGCR